MDDNDLREHRQKIDGAKQKLRELSKMPTRVLLVGSPTWLLMYRGVNKHRLYRALRSTAQPPTWLSMREQDSE